MPRMAQPRIVIVGGGFGGLFTALELAGSLDVTLVTDSDHFVFTPMLYEYFSGEVEAWHIGPRYDELLDNNVNLVKSQATTVDLHAQTVMTDQGEPLHYDVMVLAVGGVTKYAGGPCAEELTLSFSMSEQAVNSQ